MLEQPRSFAEALAGAVVQGLDVAARSRSPPRDCGSSCRERQERFLRRQRHLPGDDRDPRRHSRASSDGGESHRLEGHTDSRASPTRTLRNWERRPTVKSRGREERRAAARSDPGGSGYDETRLRRRDTWMPANAHCHCRANGIVAGESSSRRKATRNQT